MVLAFLIKKIWCQNVTVEQNKTYAFSAWVTSLIKINPPIMQFSINGNLLGEAFQTNPNPCEWEEFFQVWNSGNETNAEICIVNQNIAGNGNDFAIDEISLKETCIYEDSIEIKIDEPLQIDLGNSPTICEGDLHTLQNFASHNTNLSYLWNTGDTAESIQIQSTGKYWLKLTNDFNCSISDTLIVLPEATPESKLGLDTNICFEVLKSLTLYAGEAKYISWSKNNVEIDSKNYLEIFSSGEYKVNLSNGRNCTIEDYITIDTVCSDVIFFLNAFTPNNDRLNETFKAYCVQTFYYELLIYNRWGNLVFSSNNLQEGWDGTFNNQPASQDVYLYQCIYEIVYTQSNSVTRKVKNGTVVLL